LGPDDWECGWCCGGRRRLSIVHSGL
jgi:hypothetical protein